MTIFHMPGCGEKYWAGNSPFIIKASAAETGGSIGCLEIQTPPGAGPILHRHGREDEIFYILEGELTFFGEFGTRKVVAGTAVYVPQGTIHSFENQGNRPARLLSLFVPGGFEGYFREMCTPNPDAMPSVAEFRERSRVVGGKYGMTTVNDALPECGKREALFIGPDEAETITVMGDRVSLFLSSQQTNGAMNLFVEDALPGAGVPPHLHFREDELFYVLEGELSMMKPDGEEIVVPAGGFLYSPKGTPHAWFNRSSGVTRLLVCTTPGGFDGFFREIDGVADPGQVIATAGQYDIKFLPK